MQILDIHFIEKIEPKTKFLGFFFGCIKKNVYICAHK